MTEIKVYSEDEKIELKVSGHSGFSSAGTDIVCAGISTICYSFCELCMELNAENKIKVNNIILEDGLIELDVFDNYGVLIYPLQMLSAGLSALEENYTENIKISWGEKIF